GGGLLRALRWRRGPVGLPGPAVRQREPLAGQDQVRVGADGRAVGVVQLLPAAAYALAGRDAGEGVAADDGVHLGAARTGLRGLLRLDVLEDRKSTRLNSSHVKNSYAVLCLKKK